MRTIRRVLGITGLAGAMALAGPSAWAGKPGGGGGGTTPDPRIAFARGNSRTGLQDLMVMNADGTNQRVVVAGAGNMVAPDWSPDGTQLVYTGGIVNTYAIYTVDVSGSAAPRLVTAVRNGAYPKWSPAPAPDGSYKIAFHDTDTAAGETRPDVWLVNPDGSGRARLTQTSDESESYPCWNPAATAIAVKTQWNDTTSRQRIEVLGLAAGAGGVAVASRTTLTGVGGSPLTDRAHYAFLDWSRTSGRIAASVILPGEQLFNTWVVDSGSPGAARRVTNSATDQDRHPSWSPDDSQLVVWFNGSGPSANCVAKVASSGGTPSAILSGGKPVEGQMPAWRR